MLTSERTLIKNSVGETGNYVRYSYVWMMRNTRVINLRGLFKRR